MRTLSRVRTRRIIAPSFSSLAILLTLTLTVEAARVFDFDGDGKSDYVVSRRNGSSLYWFVYGSTAGFIAQQWGRNDGTAGYDRVVAGDYDGDGKADLAVWRQEPPFGTPSNFYVYRTTAGFQAFQWGVSGDSLPAFTLLTR